MTSLWPWLAVAGLGALHGLSPANGWLFAAAWGVQARDAAQARRALLPIGIGHLAAVGVVALAFAQGLSVAPGHARTLAGIVLVGLALRRLWRARRGHALMRPPGARRGYAGIALWSFLMAGAHGAGMMLVPALVPLCLAGNPAREITASGSLLLALAAVGVHTGAMLATTGAMASGVCRGVAQLPRLAAVPQLATAWTVSLAVTGLALLVAG